MAMPYCIAVAPKMMSIYLLHGAVAWQTNAYLVTCFARCRRVLVAVSHNVWMAGFAILADSRLPDDVLVVTLRSLARRACLPCDRDFVAKIARRAP